MDRIGRFKFDRPLAVDRLSQSVQHPSQQLRPHLHLEAIAGRHHLAAGGDPLKAPERHQQDLVPLKTDHLGPERLPSRAGDDQTKLPHLHPGDHGARDQADQLGDLSLGLNGRRLRDVLSIPG